MDGNKSKFIAVTTALAFLVTVMVVLPTTSAQTTLPACTAGAPTGSQLTVEVVDKSGGAIRPIVGEGEIDVTVTLTLDQAAKSLSPVSFEYTTSEDVSWATVVLSKTSEVKAIPDNADSVTNTIKGKVFLSKDAPAFADGKLKVTASATGGTCLEAPDDKTGETSVKAGFYGKMQARLDKTIEKAGQNSKVTIPLIVENFGNGELLTKYELVNAEKTDVDVILPGGIIVPTSVGTSLDPKQVINIDIQTPFKNGYMNSPETVTIRVTSISNDDTEIDGPEATVTALIRTQGVYVPGFELTTMLAAGLAALVGLLRRR